MQPTRANPTNVMGGTAESGLKRAPQWIFYPGHGLLAQHGEQLYALIPKNEVYNNGRSNLQVGLIHFHIVVEMCANHKI